MKFKMSAGAEFDVLTQHELDKSLQQLMLDWRREVERGPKHIRFSANGVVTDNGALTIGGDTQSETTGRLGPEQSMVWSVKRWAITGLAVNGGDSLTAYINTDQPNTLIKGDVTGYDRFGSDELVLNGGDRLLFVGSELIATAGTRVFLSGAAWELPATLAYRLL